MKSAKPRPANSALSALGKESLGRNVKKYLPLPSMDPEKDYLRVMVQRRFSLARIAERLGVTEEVAAERVKAVLEEPPPKVITAPDQAPPGVILNDVQQAFINATQHYNNLGKTLNEFGVLVGGSVHVEELEQILVECFAQHRRADDNVTTKVARELLKRCVVMVRPPAFKAEDKNDARTPPAPDV